MREYGLNRVNHAVSEFVSKNTKLLRLIYTYLKYYLIAIVNSLVKHLCVCCLQSLAL